jgi:hypothetical protein
MPTTRIVQPEIQSWTPAIDARAAESGSIFVLNGKNYAFDSKGPKSMFGSTVLQGGSIESDLYNVYYNEQDDRSILFTGEAALEYRHSIIETDDSLPTDGYWFKLADLTVEPATSIGQTAWTHAYVGYSNYSCRPSLGIFKILGDSIEPYAGTVEFDNVIAIAEANGRLIVIDQFTAYWSNSFDAEDMSPALGGAGFQVINESVPGTPIMVTTFQGGFLVWTTGGCLIAEYVGGETVYRFDRVITDQLLYNAAAFTTLASGLTVMMTQQGLYQSSPQAGLTPLSALFNEYLRGVMKENPDVKFRLNYITESDHLYVQLLDAGPFYATTYVYSMGVDKWGTFNRNHKGICRFSSTPGDYGYIDVDGYPHRFHDLPFDETVDGGIEGLNSEIELGYIRPASGSLSADIEFEIQEIVTSAVSTLSVDYVVIEEDWNGDDAFVSFNIGFYNHDEDWNGFGVADFDEDMNAESGDEDYNDGTGDTDLNDSVAGVHDFDWNDAGAPIDWGATPVGGVDTSYIIDWQDGTLNAPDEDWNGPQAFVNDVSYQLESISNLDGVQEDLSVIPTLAVRKQNMDLWTMFTSGQNHRFIYRATEPWEKFHVKFLATTVSFQGQIS